MSRLTGDEFELDSTIYGEPLDEDELEASASLWVGALTGDADEVENLDLSTLVRLFTLSTYVFDRCLLALEQRGELQVIDGVPQLPYHSDHMLDTILTREH